MYTIEKEKHATYSNYEQNSTRFTKVGNPRNFFFCPFTFICFHFSIWFPFASSGPKSSLLWFVFVFRLKLLVWKLIVGVFPTYLPVVKLWCLQGYISNLSIFLVRTKTCLMFNYRELSQTGGIHNLVYLFFDRIHLDLITILPILGFYLGNGLVQLLVLRQNWPFENFGFC